MLDHEISMLFGSLLLVTFNMGLKSKYFDIRIYRDVLNSRVGNERFYSTITKIRIEISMIGWKIVSKGFLKIISNLAK